MIRRDFGNLLKATFFLLFFVHRKKSFGITMSMGEKAANTSPSPATQVKALQFNVWLDATKVKGGLELTASTILDSEADIVSLNEVKNFWGKDFVANLKEELYRQQQHQQERQEMDHNPQQQWYGNFPGNPRKLSLDADTAIISKYPIVDEQVVHRTIENCIVRSLVQISPQRPPVAVYSVHLEYRAYSCYLPRGYNSHSTTFPGWNPILRLQKESTTSDETTPAVCPPTTLSYLFWNSLGTLYGLVVGDRTKSQMDLNPITDTETIHKDNLSSGRPDAIERILEDVERLPVNPHYMKFSGITIPVIIMGDFNEPSALDWTDTTKFTAGHNGVVYPWETTQRMLNAGYMDSYRQLHPNPLTHPGYTWPAAAKGKGSLHAETTGWIRNADERDRIDFIFYKNHPIQIQDQQLSLDLSSSSSSSSSLHPVDAWLVGTPVMVVGDKLVDESMESRRTAEKDEKKSNDSVATSDGAASGSRQDKVSLKAGSFWPSDHRAVMTVFELR